jgi:hypothetical protein
MRKFNTILFLASTLTIMFLTFISFMAAWGEDEGNKLNLFWLFFVKLFYILRFPTHVLFWEFLTRHGGSFFILGLIINCFFYGLVVERLFSLRKNKSKFTSAPNK